MKQCLFLIPIFFSFVRSSAIDEDCRCNNTIKKYIREEKNIPATLFMSEENDLTLTLTYHDKDDDLTMDFIVIKQNIYKITSYREKLDVTTTNVDLPLPITTGWKKININIKEKVVHITPYKIKIVADFPVQRIIVASDYMSPCTNGTASWKITKDHLVTIPLNGLGTSRISVTSSKEFSPVIKINFLYDMNTFMKNQSDSIFVLIGSKIPGNISSFIIENNDNIIRVSSENSECDGQIASLKLQTVLKNITASSLDEDFILTLEPTVNHTRECGASNISDPLTITLVVFILIFAGLYLILIIFIWRKRKNNTLVVSAIDERGLLLESNQGERKNNTLVVSAIDERGLLLESNQGEENGNRDSSKQFQENNEESKTPEREKTSLNINVRDRVSIYENNKESTNEEEKGICYSPRKEKKEKNNITPLKEVERSYSPENEEDGIHDTSVQERVSKIETDDLSNSQKIK